MNFKHFQKMYILILSFLFVCSSLAKEEEQIMLKSMTTKTGFIPGQQLYVYEKTEEKDHMPGNDKFGFFYRSDTKKKGICRIRAEVVCDRGLKFFTKIKNQQVVLKIQNMLFKATTSPVGVLDLIFRCPKQWQDSKATLNVFKFETQYILKNVAGKIEIPDSQCK